MKSLEAKACPICQAPAHSEFIPFCSKTCQNIDLIRWIKEDYRIPTQESPVDLERQDPDE